MPINYCEPFTVHRRINSSSYWLELQQGGNVHPMFHVRHLKEFLGSRDNMVSIQELVTLEDLFSKPHEIERTHSKN